MSSNRPAVRNSRTTDQGRYREALSDGQQAIDDLASGRESFGQGALRIVLSVGRAYLATQAPACRSCGEKPAGKKGLCDECRGRPRLKGKK